MILYKFGSRGVDVEQIQRALAGAGYGVIVDGYYGSITREAVKEFQLQNGLTPDGVVGPATLANLITFRWKKSKRTIKEIIVHCTATPEGKDFTVADIRRMHKMQGWSDIGYHYLIYRNGTVMPGRDVDIIGAHCQGHNTYSIGVCYVGGVAADGKTPKDTRTLQQRAALLKLLEELHTLYPAAKIHGHRDFANKDCPSFDATKEYKKI